MTITALAAAVVVLSGCTAPTDPPSPPASATVRASSATVPEPSAATTIPSPAAASDAPTSAARTDPNAPAGQCADAQLDVTVQNDPTGSGAGQRLSYVVLRNIGTSTCVLRGAPGVSLVGGGNGTQIGAAASRAESGAAVTIRPGSYALAPLTYPNIDEHGGAYGDGDGHDPQCEARSADGYRVYPPHGFRAFFTRVPDLYGCSTALQVLHVAAVAPAAKYADFTPTS